MKFKNLLLSLFGGLIIFIGLSSFCSSNYTVINEINFVNTDSSKKYAYSSDNNIYDCSDFTIDLVSYTTQPSSIVLFYYNSLYNYWMNQSFSSSEFPLTRETFRQKVQLASARFGSISFGSHGTTTQSWIDFPNYGSNSAVLKITCQANGDYIASCPTCPTCPTCPSQYTSEECQTEYGLITTGVLNECIGDLTSCQSSLSGCQLDLNSCQSSLSGWDNSLNNCSNNLLSCQSSLSSCIAGNCPLDNGDNVQWSSLFINNIQHIGAPLININIPEEISWDYTSSTGSFDLDVEGYNVDADYIEGVINIQNSKPTTEDFNKIITQVIPLFVPGLVIILFIYFVFKLLKKVF